MSANCLLGFKVNVDPSRAEYALVKASKTAGNSKIVMVEKNSTNGDGLSILGNSFCKSAVEFEFQRVKYIFNSEKNIFERLNYPCTAAILNFMKYSGYSKHQDVSLAHSIWGKNEFDIPLPSFASLYLVSICKRNLTIVD